MRNLFKNLIDFIPMPHTIASVRRTILLAVLLLLTPFGIHSAEANCSTAPNKALIRHTVDASGIDFFVTPADTGCPATKLSYAFAYYDQGSSSWEKWSAWVIGSTTGKAFNFRVPAIKGKTRVTVAIEANNKWGNAELTRENNERNGIAFQSASMESLTPTSSTVINAVLSGQAYTFEISHPESAICSNFIASSTNLLRNYNCNIPISYRVTSQSTSPFYGNGKVFTDLGADVGFFGNTTFGDTPGTDWRKSTIYVSMPSDGSVYLSFTGAGSHHTYAVVSKKPINLRVKSAAEVAAEKAAIEKAAADKAAAEAAKERQAQEAKKLTISCVKGASTRKVTGETPSCPSGFRNPMSNYLTFQAFSQCKLYKKDADYGGARLRDGGRTLVLDAVKETSYSLNRLTLVDLACVKKVIKMPAFVDSKVGSTRAIDGMQTAQWGKLSAFWTYHPDDGLNISFNNS